MKRRRRAGFTLVELLVVVLVLGILVGVALPMYLSAVADSKEKTCQANMHSIKSAAQAYYVKNGSFTADMADLLGDLQTAPVCPSAGTYTVGGAADTGPTVSCSEHGAL